MLGTQETRPLNGERQRGQRLIHLMPDWRPGRDLQNLLGTLVRVDQVLATIRNGGVELSPELLKGHQASLEEEVGVLADSVVPFSGSLAVAMSGRLVRSSRAAPLVRDYQRRADAAKDQHVLVIPKDRITAVKALPLPNADGGFDPVLDIRIVSATDPHTFVYVTHEERDKRLVEMPSIGRWYRWPVSEIELTTLQN